MRINSFTQRNGLHLDNLRGTFKLKQTDSKIKRLILKPFLAIKDRAYLVIRPFIKEEPPIVKQQVAKVSKSIASGIKKQQKFLKLNLLKILLRKTNQLLLS